MDGGVGPQPGVLVERPLGVAGFERVESLLARRTGRVRDHSPNAFEDAGAPAGGEPAIDHQGVAGDERGVVGHQEGGGRRDLGGLAEPVELVLVDDLVPVDLHGRVAQHAVHHRGVDEAGADAVGPDALGAVVDGQVLGQEDDPALRGVVGAAPLGALEPFDAGQVDDAALALVDHGAQGVLGHQERAGQVDVDHPPPLGQIEQVHRTPTGDPGGVDHRVEPTVGGHDGRHQVGHRRLVGDVDGVVDGRSVRVDGRGPVDGYDRGTLGGQADGGGTPDARRRAGDQGHRLVQSTHAVPLTGARHIPHRVADPLAPVLQRSTVCNLAAVKPSPP